MIPRSLFAFSFVLILMMLIGCSSRTATPIIVGGVSNQPSSVQARYVFTPKAVYHLETDVYGVSFPAGGKRVAARSSFGIQIFDLEGGQEKTCSSGFSGVALSPSGELCAEISSETLRILRVGEQTPFKVYRDSRFEHVVGFSPDGKSVLVRDQWNKYLVNVETGAITMEIHRAWGTAYSHDGQLLAAEVRETGPFAGNLVRVYDTNNGRIVSELETSASSLAFSPDGTLLAVGGSDWGLTGNVFVYEVETGRKVFDWHQKGNVLSLSFSPDGKQLAMSIQLSGFFGSSGEVKVVDLSNGSQVAAMTFEDTVWEVQFSPDSQLLAMRTWSPGIVVRSGGAFIYDVAKEQLVYEAPIAGAVRDVAFSEDGSLIGFAGMDEMVHVVAVKHVGIE